MDAWIKQISSGYPQTPRSSLAWHPSNPPEVQRPWDLAVLDPPSICLDQVLTTWATKWLLRALLWEWVDSLLGGCHHQPTHSHRPSQPAFAQQHQRVSKRQWTGQQQLQKWSQLLLTTWSRGRLTKRSQFDKLWKSSDLQQHLSASDNGVAEFKSFEQWTQQKPCLSCIRKWSFILQAMCWSKPGLGEYPKLLRDRQRRHSQSSGYSARNPWCLRWRQLPVPSILPK